jgi:hypothetical protein
MPDCWRLCNGVSIALASSADPNFFCPRLHQASSRYTLLVLLALDQCSAIAHGYLASVITVRALLVKLVV